MTLLLPLHVVAGATAIAFGFIALFAMKGAAMHRATGQVFVCAMLVMSLSGTVMAFGRAGAAVNIPAGLVTAYLVITSLVTVRPASVELRRVERTAMWAAFALGVASIVASVVNASRGSIGVVSPLLLFGILVLSAGVGDWRMIRAGGLQGGARLKRHLWRMSVALFIASASFFLGPVRRIPVPLRGPAFRLIPLVVLVTMAYWLWRVGRRRIARTRLTVRTVEVAE